MRRGYVVFFKTASVILVITGLVLIQCMGLCVGKANAWADINSLANRSTRHYLPFGYLNNGSAIEKVVHTKEVGGVGNVGIGNGSLTALGSGVKLDPSGFMLPKKYSAGEVVMNGASPSVVIGEPQKDIFHEFPWEPGGIYGKLLGVPMPGNNRVDIAVETIGYKHYDPRTFPEEIMRISKVLGNVTTISGSTANNSTAK